MHTPLVCIIVLNWNRWQQTLSCLASLSRLGYPNYKIVVVDNGSTDGSVAEIRTAYPALEILETGANLGYAGGNNQGILRVLADDADYVLVLNNDTEVATDLLDVLVMDAASHPDGAFFSPRIYDLEHPERISYSGGIWNSQSLVVNFVADESVDAASTPVTETDVCHGCAIFFPRQTIEKIGLMEERFFLVFEETDWCFRARRAGMRCYVSHRGRVWHQGALSFGGEQSPLRQYFHTRNFLLFGERYLSPRHFLRLLMLVWRETFQLTPRKPNAGWLPNLKRWYWNTHRVFHLWRRRREDPLFLGKWSGFRDYCLRRFGDCPAEVRSLR